jgi:hypothetical protein
MNLCDPRLMGHDWERTTAENYRRCRRCGVVERLNDDKWVLVDPKRMQRRRKSQEQAALWD